MMVNDLNPSKPRPTDNTARFATKADERIDQLRHAAVARARDAADHLERAGIVIHSVLYEQAPLAGIRFEAEPPTVVSDGETRTPLQQLLGE